MTNAIAGDWVPRLDVAPISILQPSLVILPLLRYVTSMHFSPAPPREITPFLGRRELLGWLVAALDDPECRLIQLVGPPGAGKSRLAAEAVKRLTDDGRGAGRGLWLAIDDGTNLDERLSIALDVVASRASDLRTCVIRALNDAPTVLVLDDGDRAEALESTVSAWIGDCPRLTVLVTARRTSTLVGGVTRALGAISSVEEATSLLQSRVDAPISVEAAGRLFDVIEPLPLAIEMIAPLINAFGFEDALAALQNDPGLVLDLEGVTVQRGSTNLRRALDVCWSRLDASARNVLLCVGLFRSPFSPGDAARVSGMTNVVTPLLELQRASWLLRDDDGWHQLGVIAEWCRHQRSTTPESAEGLQRYHACIADRAEQLLRVLESSHDGEARVRLRKLAPDLHDVWGNRDKPSAAHIQVVGLALGALYDTDFVPSVRAAHASEMLQYAGDPVPLEVAVLACRAYSADEQIERALAIGEQWRAGAGTTWADAAQHADSSALFQAWVRTLAMTDPTGAMAMMETALVGLDRTTPIAARGMIAATAGVLTLLTQGDVPRARMLLDEGIACLDTSGATRLLMWALTNRGIAAVWDNDPAATLRDIDRALALGRRVGPRTHSTVFALDTLAWAALDLGRHNVAAAAIAEAKQLAQLLGDTGVAQRCQMYRGVLAYDQGDPIAAIEVLEPLVEVARVNRDDELLGRAGLELGEAYWVARNHADAETILQQVLALDPSDALQRILPAVAALLASILAERGAHGDAVGWLSRADALLGKLQIPSLKGFVAIHRAVVEAWQAPERAEATLRQILDDVMTPVAGRGAPWFVDASVRQATRHALRLVGGDVLRQLIAEVVSELPCIVVNVEGDEAFVGGHQPWRLSRSPILQRLFLAFVAHASEQHEPSLSFDALVEACWPDESLAFDTAHNRLHNALSKLRKLPGLRDLIETNEDGWRLRGDVSVLQLPL